VGAIVRIFRWLQLNQLPATSNSFRSSQST